jgi:hypothetical protein
VVTACTGSSNPSGSTDDGGSGFDGAGVTLGDSGGTSDAAGNPTDSSTGDSSGPDSATDAGEDGSSERLVTFCAPSVPFYDTLPDGGDAGEVDASPQVFSATMAGCPCAVYWSQRAALCGTSCTPCSTAQWVAQHGSIAPAFDYWTNDDLGYGGDFGSGTFCTAYFVEAGANLCSNDEGDVVRAGVGDDASVDSGVDPSPMRVCYSDPVNHPYASVPDPLGNGCNWNDCAYGPDAALPDAGPDAGLDAAALVFDYMGGCDDNLTAGTLCCCP